MTVSGSDVIARSTDFEAAANCLVLRPWQWNLLHSLDGRAELRDIAVNCGLDLDTAIAFVDESEAAGLVRVVSMSLNEYRMWNATQTAAAPADTLESYATTIPSWMIAPIVRDAPVAEIHHEEPVAEMHHEEPAPEVHYEEPVAEVHYGEPVAEMHHEEAAADGHHYEPAVEEQHEECAPYRHDEEPVAEVQPLEEPIAEVEHDEPAATDQPAEPWTADSSHTDAAKAVADLVGRELAPAELEAAAEQPAERTSVSLSFGDPEATAFSTNGIPYDSTWEPMSLLTAVDRGPMQATPEAAYDSMDGVSISLGAPAAEPQRVEPEHATQVEPQRGGVSFSLSPENSAPWDDAAPQMDATVPVSHYEIPAPAHDETPAAPPASPVTTHEDASIAAHGETPVDAVGGIAAAPAAGSSITGDIVGNLIARALTFRIK